MEYEFTSPVRTECDMFVMQWKQCCMCTLSILSNVLCVLMVECMSIVVNVMLSLMSVMSRALCILLVCTVVKLCTLGLFALGLSLVS